jgi:hypothetical protein
MTEHLGIDGYFGTSDSTEILVRSDGILIKDEIIKNDFVGVSSMFFTKVRLFVLILKYNCFTHELHMPGVRLFY